MQHLLVVRPAQSVSVWQRFRPAEDCSQILGAPGASDLVSQPSPPSTSQSALVAQMRGHEADA